MILPVCAENLPRSIVEVGHGKREEEAVIVIKVSSLQMDVGAQLHSVDCRVATLISCLSPLRPAFLFSAVPVKGGLGEKENGGTWLGSAGYNAGLPLLLRLQSQ